MADDKDPRLTTLLRSLSRKDWLTPEMEEYFEGRIPEQWWGPNPKVHPSGAVGDCSRDIQLSLLGHKTPVPGRLSRIFDVGKAMHMRWQQYFEERGLMVLKEEPIETDNGKLAIKGKLDIVIKAPQSVRDELFVVELKSMTSGQYRRLPQPKEPSENLHALARLHPRYIGQWLTYSRAFDIMRRQEGKSGVDSGILLFENKDNQEYQVYFLVYDEELWDRLTANAQIAQRAFLENRLVDPPYMRFSAPCQRCGRRELCYKLQEGDGEAWRQVKARLAAGLKRYRGRGSRASSTGKGASPSSEEQADTSDS